MSETKTPVRRAVGYDEDFHTWTADQAARLRACRPDGIDWQNVAEEIETLGRSDKREIRSRLIVILTHLLKWHFQPERRKYGWRATLLEQRIALAELLADSPSLQQLPEQALGDCYPRALGRAAEETDLPLSALPATCPYLISQVLDADYFPGPADPDVR